MTLQFNISKQRIERADNEQPVADSKNYLYAKFNFLTNEWDNVAKSAIFTDGENTYTVLIDNDEVLVPWELIHEGIIEVSCFGGDLVTTNTAKIRISPSGYTDGETPQPPTPSVYSEITQSLHNISSMLKRDGDGNKYLADNGIYKEIAKSIEHIKVNGVEQEIIDNAVDIDIPSVPENVSAFNNDAGYLTEHQSLDDYATKVYVDNEMALATAIAKGRATGYVFDTKDDMELALEDEDFVDNLVLGDNLYIRATDTPDYWWDGAEAQQLETQKVDLSEYIKKTTLATDSTLGLVKTGFASRLTAEGILYAVSYSRASFPNMHGLSFLSVNTLKNIIDTSIPDNPDGIGIPTSLAVKNYVTKLVTELLSE